MKGIIALDIDGTITVDEDRLEIPVKKYIEGLVVDGWKLILVTGRTFSFSRPILEHIAVPFFCSTQNGAAFLEMPQAKLISKQYLPKEIIFKLAPLFKQHQIGMLIETGIENQDQCFFRWEDFAENVHDYLYYRMSISPESWVPVKDFNEIDIVDFPVIKYFADQAAARILGSKVEEMCQNVRATVISDPFRPGSFLAHINQKNASKGNAVRSFKEMMPSNLPLIAAGDDYNDIDMLQAADIKIVMKNAPAEVLEIADIVAPAAKELGIITGLKKALVMAHENYH